VAKYVSGNIYIYVMEALAVKDGVVPPHSHNFDHTTYIVRGAARIEKLDKDGSVERSIVKRATDEQNWVLIRAGVLHRITSLEHGTVGHCIYSHRDARGEVVQEFTGWESQAYV
jgi:hypothetical protein